MGLDILLLLVGMSLLLGGGELMVRGASSIARHFGVSPLVIGLTVVAFGTSAPELAVNLKAALGGDPGISFGNITGSNLANIGLIVGCAALLRPLEIHANVIRREIPMMLVATVAVLVMSLDTQLRDAASASFDRPEGIILLGLFGVFLFYTARDMIKARAQNGGTDSSVPGSSSEAIPLSIARTVIGIAGLVGGAEITVGSAKEIARAIGVPDFIISFTMIAIGTSLPELVTAIVATRRGATDLAVGNVVGSNIFNLLFVLATTSVIAPIALPPDAWIDLVAVLVVSMMLLPFSITARSRIVRWEGICLLIAYFGYVGWRALS